MSRKLALPIAFLVWLFFAWFLWATLVGVNMGSICGRVLAPWAYVAEKIVFLPTLWLTRPLDQWLELKKAGLAITIGSVIETALLATGYSTIAYLLLRRTLWQSTLRVASRYGWALSVAMFVMIATSLWLRAQLRAADYGAPLRHEAEKVVLHLRTPLAEPGRTITMTRQRAIPIPGGPADSLEIVAREGALPLVIQRKTNYVREPEFQTTTEYLLYRILPDRLESLPSLVDPEKNGSSIGEVRCAYGSAAEVLVSLPGGGGAPSYTMSLTAPALTKASVDLDSQEAIGEYAVGIGSGSELRIARGSQIIGTRPDFGDHTLNNVAFTRTGDGILHIVGTEVLVPNGNSCRVHYLRFDSGSRRWIGDDVLMVRASFTSTSTPRIARTGDALDAYWHMDSGQTPQPEDGIYARRIGDPDTWHLIAESAEFVVLQSADDRGSTLIGAATNPSRSGVVRWFLRRDGVWYDIGQTDAHQKLYTLDNTGTEPFALWRGEVDGTVHAAFNGLGQVVLEDLRLPD
ncbi:MAG: hypothetical protein U0X73_07975 [Thermoanaerobaculia bacterium]